MIIRTFIWVIEQTNFKVLWDLYVFSLSPVISSLYYRTVTWLFTWTMGRTVPSRCSSAPRTSATWTTGGGTRSQWRGWAAMYVTRHLQSFIVRRGWGLSGEGFNFRDFVVNTSKHPRKYIAYSCLYVNFCNLDICGGWGGAIIVNIHVYCKCTTSQIFIHIVCTLTMLDIGLFR